jgi:hypothetical protein
MISPEELRTKSLRLFGRYLNWVLDEIQTEVSEGTAAGNTDSKPASTASSFFPLIVPADRGTVHGDLSERKRAIELLWEGSKKRKGKGYSLEMGLVKTKRNG